MKCLICYLQKCSIHQKIRIWTKPKMNYNYDCDLQFYKTMQKSILFCTVSCEFAAYYVEMYTFLHCFIMYRKIYFSAMYYKRNFFFLFCISYFTPREKNDLYWPEKNVRKKAANENRNYSCILRTLKIQTSRSNVNLFWVVKPL